MPVSSKPRVLLPIWISAHVCVASRTPSGRWDAIAVLMQPGDSLELAGDVGLEAHVMMTPHKTPTRPSYCVWRRDADTWRCVVQYEVHTSRDATLAIHSQHA